MILPNRAKPGFIQSGNIVQVFEVSHHLFSDPNKTNISQMERNRDDQRVIGEPWAYLGLNTFVYGSTVDKAIEAAQRLEKETNVNLKKRSTSSESIGLSRQSTLKSTIQRESIN